MVPGTLRLLAARIVLKVHENRQSLSGQVEHCCQEYLLSTLDRRLLTELATGALRWSHRLDAVLAQLLNKPLRKRDQDLYCLLKIGLYQLQYTRIPAHAAVNETVAACRPLGKVWAERMVNAVLRNAQRQESTLEAKLEHQQKVSYPGWLYRAIRTHWGSHAAAIFATSNQRPDLVLRVDTSRIGREQVIDQLAERGLAAQAVAGVASALRLHKAVPPATLPGFAEGLLSVQDAGAQLAAPWLTPSSGQRVLDACAAPGGKTAHIAQLQPGCKITAIDLSDERLQRVRENLQRIGYHKAEVFCADATQPDSWWSGNPYDRILLDAPCSGSGVIRRHPDIKILRQPQDIGMLAESQKTLLHALWPLLKSGGKMLYVTCSLLPEENQLQITDFLNYFPDAKYHLPNGIGLDTGHGRQLLPGIHATDGFFYACLEKL
ncbi:MAG TPA: 16S rRNA (cytosine(967)-C(5))-methyltransferase RsmB [Gammaproteobacteria bacterium]|nr:16S rRNA (cytosine(967)-C(5))-methyltransferase RsmB [Gammaproteobacteria bacterium]